MGRSRLTVGRSLSSTVSNRAVERQQLWLMDLDGRNKRLLLNRNASDMAWSPDGSRIAFESYTDPTTSASPFDIWVVNADGSDARNLTQGRYRRHYGANLVADGKRLAFRRLAETAVSGSFRSSFWTLPRARQRRSPEKATTSLRTWPRNLRACRFMHA